VNGRLRHQRACAIGVACVGVWLSVWDAAYAQPNRGQPTDLRISFIDVGQGDAIWIKTPDTGSGSKNIIIDGGPDRGAQNRLTKYLTTYDLPPGSVIDYLIVTHPHDDHYPALLDILAQYKVKTIIDSGFEKLGEYEDFLKAARAEKVDGRSATVVDLGRDTEKLDFGAGVNARFLHVFSADLKGMGSGNTKENNASAVLRLEFGPFSFLLMGDAEGKEREQPAETIRFVEKILLSKFKPDELRADVLKAGHHGSETGSTMPFLKVVEPRVVVIMSGRRTFNGRSIPDDPVIKRYGDINEDVLVVRTDEKDEEELRTTKTDQDGDDIYMRTDGKTLRVYQAFGPVGKRRWLKVGELQPR
jgi:competence protein ComEC